MLRQQAAVAAPGKAARVAGRRSFGNVRELKSGRHQARYRAPDGQIYKAEQTFPRKADANAWLATVQADMVRGSWKAPKRSTSTVGDYVSSWIAGHQGLKRTTRKSYEDLHRLHIKPAIGSVRLRDLTTPAVRDWNTKLRARLATELAAKRAAALAAGRTLSDATQRDGSVTAAKAYRLLRTALATAVEDGEIETNPCRVKGAGVSKAAERPTASVDEVLQLAAAVPARYRCLVLFAAFLGPRVGELAALRRRDVVGGEIQVEERVYYLGGSYDYDDPKSAAGKRHVPLGDALERELENHLAEYVGHDADALVFTTSNGRPVLTSYYQWWKRARDKVGRPDLRFHDLRHTGMTLAAMSGATQRELQRRMGQATAAAAAVYMHTTDEHSRAVSDQLSAVLTAHQQGDKVVPLRPVQRRKRATG
jgi:integrase